MRQIMTMMFGILLALGAAGVSAAQDPPQTVTIDRLAQYFSGVTFDHRMHQEVTGCFGCHHHTTGDGAEPQCAGCHQGRKFSTVACRDCHVAEPFSAVALREKEQDRARYHIDKPGLKGAYHRNCLGCHEEVGGPLGCEDCHAKTAAGDALYYSGSQAPRPQNAAVNAH